MDTVTISPGDLPREIGNMAQGGASVIQLRGKSATTRQLLDYGRVVRELCLQNHLAFIVNDRLDVALALEADGVHVGQDDMPVSIVRKLAPSLTVGLSAGSLQEIECAADCPPDYFGLGPVFATLSKDDAGMPLGTEKTVRLVKRAAAIAPVVAIGGINPENAAQAWKSGVDGVAVISAVMNASDKRTQCLRLLAARGLAGLG
jgi:thiamine-phosphate pyrophosphorylase